MAAESGRIFPYRSFEIAAILVQEKVLDSAALKLKVHGEQGLRMSANEAEYHCWPERITVHV